MYFSTCLFLQFEPDHYQHYIFYPGDPKLIPLPLPSQNGKISEINVKMPLFQFYTFLEQQLSGVHFFFTYRSLLSIKNIGDCDWPTKFYIYIHFILRNVFIFFILVNRNEMFFSFAQAANIAFLVESYFLVESRERFLVGLGYRMKKNLTIHLKS